MSLDDALGDSNAALRDSLLRQYQQGDPKFSTDAGALAERLTRKVGSGDESPSVPEVYSSPQPEEADVAKKPPPEPKPSTDDLSKFGTPVAPSPQPSLGATGQLVAGLKQAGRSAGSSVGGIVQGAGTPAPPMSTAVQEAAAGIDPANNWPLPGAPTDRELVPPAAPPNAAQQALINTGKRMRGAVESAIPMTPQEQASGGAAVGGVIGGALPYVLAGAVDPGLGLIAGAGGMSLSSAGQTYEAAKAKGASDGDAAEAAGISGVIGGALGILPLGAVMKPIEQASPGIKGYVAAKLAQAGISGTTFATIGEAQEYLTQQIAKHYYDPQAGYSPDATRAIANFIGGGALGSMHPLEARIQRSTPEQIAEFLRRHREWMDRQPRQVDGPEPAEGEIVPERRGLPGPDTSEASPSAPETPPPSSPSGGAGEAATPPKTDHQTLLDEGFREKEIADMSPRVRAQRLETAKSGNPEAQSDLSIKGAAESAPDAAAAGTQRAAGRAPRSRDARVVTTTVDDALKAPEAVKENRPPAPAAPGVTQLGRLEIPHLGLTGKYGITIETGAGQTRTSKNFAAQGKSSREVQTPVAWGRIKGIGNDGDHLDVFVGPRLQSPHVFIINQRDPTSDKLDGHKVLAGFVDRKTAERAYLDSFPNNAMPRIGNVNAMTPVQFQDWLKSRDHVEHGQNTREEGAQEEVTAAHHQAIEDVLSPTANKVQPVHIARAAELLAEHPGISPGIAFQHAVTENAVNKGDLTVAAAEDATGPENKEILRTQGELAHSGGPRGDDGHAKAREKRTGAHLHAADGSTPRPSQEAPARVMPLTKHGAAKRAELERLLTEVVHKMVPSVKIKFHEGRIDHIDQGGWGDVAAKYKGVVGLYRPAKQLIELSLESGNPVSAAFHEAYHAIEHLLQTARERALMAEETPRLRRAIDNGLVGFDKATIEGLAGYEVRAVAFELYRHQRDKFGKTQNLHVSVRRWYHRLTDMTNRIRNGVNGLGFQTAEDIFAKAYEGGFAGRSPPPLGTSPRQDEALASVRNPFNGPLRDSLGEKMDEVLASKTNKALEGYHDLSRSVRVLQDNIEARLAGELPDSQAMYTKKRLFPGKVGADVQDFNKDHLDPLFAMLKARGLTLEQAGDLVYAMHAGERNREMDKINMWDMHRPAADQVLGRGSGLSNSEAQKILDQYPQSLRDDVTRRIKGIRDFINRTMVKDGLETQATIDGWNATYKNYVPLSGWEDAPEDAPPGSGGRFNVRGPEVRSAFGRTSKANNPLVNLIDQAYRTIERARKNEYLLSVDNALHELEADDLKNFVRFNKGVAKKVLDKGTGLVKVAEDSNYRNDPGAVTFKRAGQTRYMIFENKQLADAIKNMHADGLDWAQPLLNFQNKLKSLWTHYSPDFLIRHFLFRYPVEGFLNSFEQGAGNVPRYMAESFPFFGDASRAIFASNKGATHENPKIREMQRYWEEMRRAGGSMTFRSMRDTDLLREHLNNAITSLSKNPLRTVQNKAHAFSEAMDVVTNALDNALRLAAFAAARRQGKTPEQSALLAREATVDFQKSGKWKNRLGLVFPFGNIAIQTGARMTGALARSRTMQGVFGATLMAGFLSTMFNYLVGGEDKDGNPFMDKIPEWNRRLNFTLLNPFHHDEKGRPVPIHIPMPYNWAFPLTLGSAMASMIFSKDKHSTRSMLGMVTKSALEVMTPFGQEENLAAVLAPEIVRPAIHIYTNKNYNGLPIHSDYSNQSKPNAYSGRRSTGDGWKYVAEGLNDLTGGARNKGGIIDMYPEDIRTLFDYPFGAQRRFVERGAETAHSIAAGKEPDYSKAPLAGVILGTDYDAADRARHFERDRESKQPWIR